MSDDQNIRTIPLDQLALALQDRSATVFGAAVRLLMHGIRTGEPMPRKNGCAIVGITPKHWARLRTDLDKIFDVMPRNADFWSGVRIGLFTPITGEISSLNGTFPPKHQKPLDEGNGRPLQQDRKTTTISTASDSHGADSAERRDSSLNLSKRDSVNYQDRSQTGLNRFTNEDTTPPAGENPLAEDQNKTAISNGNGSEQTGISDTLFPLQTENHLAEGSAASEPKAPSTDRDSTSEKSRVHAAAQQLWQKSRQPADAAGGCVEKLASQVGYAAVLEKILIALKLPSPPKSPMAWLTKATRQQARERSANQAFRTSGGRDPRFNIDGTPRGVVINTIFNPTVLEYTIEKHIIAGTQTTAWTVQERNHYRAMRLSGDPRIQIWEDNKMVAGPAIDRDPELHTSDEISAWYQTNQRAIPQEQRT